jgi:hypothetical protein
MTHRCSARVDSYHELRPKFLDDYIDLDILADLNRLCPPMPSSYYLTRRIRLRS